MKKIHLHAGAVVGKKLVLSPLSGLDTGGLVYIVQINHRKLLLDMYGKDHLLEKITDDRCVIVFGDLEVVLDYIDIENTSENIMDQCVI